MGGGPQTKSSSSLAAKAAMLARFAVWRVVLVFGLPGALAAVGGAMVLHQLAGGEALWSWRAGGRRFDVTPDGLWVVAPRGGVLYKIPIDGSGPDIDGVRFVGLGFQLHGVDGVDGAPVIGGWHYRPAQLAAGENQDGLLATHQEQRSAKC